MFVFLIACDGATLEPGELDSGNTRRLRDANIDSDLHIADVSSISDLNTSDIASDLPASSKIITLKVLKAFPTALGAAGRITGGRGGDVRYVNNRSARGEGSFYDILKKSDPKKHTTILFDIGGGLFEVGHATLGTWANLKGRKNITVGGQSANSLGGIEFTNRVLEAKDDGSFYFNHSKNIILRFAGFRGGWQALLNGSTGRIGQLAFTASQDIMLDHVSAGWGSYGVMMYGYTSKMKSEGTRVTIQNNLWHESISGHNVSVPLGIVHGVYKSITDDPDARLSLWKNLDIKIDLVANSFIGINHRQPANFGGGEQHTSRQINNYVYHWGTRVASASDSVKVDYVNNLFEASLATRSHTTQKMFKWNVHDDVMQGSTGKEPKKKPSFYLKGNEFRNVDGTKVLASTQDQWNALTHYTTDKIIDRSYERKTPIVREVPIPLIDIEVLKERVLNNSGSGVRFDAHGEIYNASKIDQNYIAIAMQKKGPTKSSKFLFASSNPDLHDDGWGDPARFVHKTNPEKRRDKSTWNYSANLPKSFMKKHGVSDCNEIKDKWDIQGYTIINQAGYTALEIWLAQEAGDFHVLAKLKQD